MATEDPQTSAAEIYAVEVEDGDQGWEVRIVGSAATGPVVSLRHCATETEARTYASTVIQHLDWLSVPKFREYYRV